MERLMKFLKKRFSKGFTLLVVPNSQGAVKSCSIPFAAVVIIGAVVLFNIYIFFAYSTQIGQIARFHQDIHKKNVIIGKMKAQQKEVQPALEKSRQIVAELNKLKETSAQVANSWQSIQQKSGRSATPISRGNRVRIQPYQLHEQNSPASSVKDKDIQTTLDKLQGNLSALSEFINTETRSEKTLLAELKGYERYLDHSPSTWPVYSRINSYFGGRRNPFYGGYDFHTGIDIQASYGTPVRAAADGVVEVASYYGGYGYAVIINHGYGYKTLYGHNSRILVTVGQTVKKRQIICYSGNSGSSTGPHLHYEVRAGSTPLDPIRFLRN